MKYTVDDKNWCADLRHLIEKAKDGDIIIVSTKSMEELAERVRTRMCPNKKLTFELASSD